MHTARQLDQEQFQITIDGAEASRDDLMVDWSPLSRFGMVMDRPFGSIGASYLMQLAITAFYDTRPRRRETGRPIYPEVYLFHVGDRYGDHMYFDVFPPRKEVFLRDDPAEVLEAINDRGITHLAVPDGPAQSNGHAWKEPSSALDRLAVAWAYSPSGRTPDADISVGTASSQANANGKISLHPKRSYAEAQQAKAEAGAVVLRDDEFLREPPNREDEVAIEIRDAVREGRTQLTQDGVTTETYRRIDPADALKMLGRRR